MTGGTMEGGGGDAYGGNAHGWERGAKNLRSDVRYK